MTEYVVRFSELKEDKETFEFILEESFFNVFQSNDWEGGRIKAKVDVYKRPDGISLDFDLKGTLMVVCDRCLDEFPLEIEFVDQLFVKYGQGEDELDDNVVVISRDDNQINLSQFLYEYLVLSIPVTKAHPDTEEGGSGCNPEMIEKLNKYVVSEETEAAKDTENIDPRWDDLKKLFDKN
ncbi:MAG: DUF177 domain-containing protein [Bacteroidales bacterium]|jgi:uncharacterized protein|nr:DUF177 domain-containing protein [Bacteroidales bacterium]